MLCHYQVVYFVLGFNYESINYKQTNTKIPLFTNIMGSLRTFFAFSCNLHFQDVHLFLHGFEYATVLCCFMPVSNEDDNHDEDEDSTTDDDSNQC